MTLGELRRRLDNIPASANKFEVFVEKDDDWTFDGESSRCEPGWTVPVTNVLDMETKVILSID